MQRCMIIDSNNFYLRSYIVDPTVSIRGVHIGGLNGYFKSLQKIVREMNPDKIVVVWDGEGGSRARKQKNKDYKSGRKPIRLNRNLKVADDDEKENMIWQMSRTYEYLTYCPVHQMMIKNVEADDIISFVKSQLTGWQKIIVSSDKDFIQLLDKETVLYRPAQTELLNAKRVIEKYGIHPINFALARSITSDDKGDNIKGVEGVGLKTVANRFPFLSEDKSYDFRAITDHCKLPESKQKCYTSILESMELVKKNYDLIQLDTPKLDYFSIQEIKGILKEKLNFNKNTLYKLMLYDGCTGWNCDSLFKNFNKMVFGQ